MIAAAVAVACSDPSAPLGPPAAIRAVTATTFTANAGSTIPGGLTVHVVDYRDRDVAAVKVAFSIVTGDGDVSNRLVPTDANGNAHTEWTLGQTAGQNEVLASIEGIDSTKSFTATGTPGPAVGLAVSPRILRLPVGTSSATVAGAVVDQYGNAVSTGATFESRNPALVTVNPTTGAVTVVSRGGTTYVVATGSTFKDSSLVIVLASGDPACTGIAAKVNPAVGDVITTGFVENGICIQQTVTGGEYALVPFYESSVPSAQTTITMSASGIRAPGALGALRRQMGSIDGASEPAISTSALQSLTAAHDRMRLAESREMPSRAKAARRWYADASVSGRTALRAAAVPAVGDQLQLNVNPNDFCSNATMRTGRVAAVTTRTIIVHDMANPAGFTDAEYQSFGVNFDTLVYALDVSNFGLPTDIDANGERIVLFFTHAVNELGAGTLGYFYGRDLLPKNGPLGTCPGSNVAEIMYLLVPDATTSKAYVLTNTVGTAAHEFQHLINSSRRLYLNPNAAPTEERWLNEGLSHIAEELMFYRTTGLTPRQNVGIQIFTAPYSQKYLDYQFNNFGRFREYIKVPEAQAPIGVNDDDDDLATRGAIWSFLRYAADQRFSSNETQLWLSLVNSNSTGMTNLYEHLGADTRLVMRDWALSVFLDDLVATNAKYQQPSWNLRQVIGGYAPFTQSLVNGQTSGFSIRAAGTVFARFGLNAGGEAYVSAAGTGTQPLPRYVRLALVRTK